MTANPNPNSTGAAAVEYTCHGWSICAIPRGQKGPIGKGWNLRENKIDGPSAAAGLTGNLGLLHAFSGTMALDLDDMKRAQEWLLARGVNLSQLFAAPDAVEIISGREGRGKLLYSLPTSLDEPLRSFRFKEDETMILEFRCADAGGHSMQDVLPPSIHPKTGKSYHWGGSGDWRELPTIPDALLRVWLDELTKQSRNNSSLAPVALPPLPSGLAPQIIERQPPYPELEQGIFGMTVLESALDFVPSDTDYDTWRDVCWAIMSTGWKGAEQIVHGWSARALHRYNPDGTNDLIRTFDPAKGITIGTLLYYAKRNGWIAPLRHPPVPPSDPLSPTARNTEQYIAVDWSSHGDIRNARNFVAMFGGKLRYVHGIGKWLRWSDERWLLCEQGQEVEAAKDAAQAMMADATATLAADQDKGKWRAREAIAAHNVARLEATLKLARSEPGMATVQASLDADPMLLGVGNGVVDLKSSTLISNSPELLVTRHCGADYLAGATCPRWLQFMAEVFGGDQTTIDTAQRLLGYTLSGLNVEEIIVFCVGFGANGKSIFGNIISRILDGYGKNAPHSLLAARRNDDHGARGDIAMLAGARLVSVNELPGGMQLDEQVVKSLAGREQISARHLYGEFFAFDPRFTIWVRTNHRPIIKGDDDGIWRRIVILPFRQKFEGARCDPNLEAKLWAERDGILTWMIEGARRYLDVGSLGLSAKILAEQRQYRSESDLRGEFLTDHTVIDAEARVGDKILFGEWREWCGTNGCKAGTKRTFTTRLAERGFPNRSSHGQRYYQRLRLSSRI